MDWFLYNENIPEYSEFSEWQISIAHFFSF